MNPHQVLGVAPSATPEQIKSAYRKLAMEHHPDRNGGTEEAGLKFQEIQNAYDMLRSDKPQQQQQQQQQQSYDHMHHMNMHEIFENFFNRQQMGNPNLQAHCAVTLEQAFTGCTVTFQINGKDVAVPIPAGIDNGQTIRVAGAAGQPNPNFPAGDLHVVVRLQQHPIFHRHGMTLISRMKIDLLDLITGCEKEITTIKGEVKKFTVPANSTPDSGVVVAGEGMAGINSSQRGDLMMHFEVEYPTFTAQQLKTLRKMKKA